MATNALESTVKAEWGEAKGFYWTPLFEDIGKLLTEKKKERFLVASLKGLIAYGVMEEEDLKEISDNDEKFVRKLSAKGIPKVICVLLFKKYVVEATMLEAIGKNAFLREVKELIDEEMPCLKKQEVFFGLFGLMKYHATTKVQLRNISDDDEKFTRKLSARGVPDAICDLLFEKYVAKKDVGFPPLANKSVTESSSHANKKRKVAKIEIGEFGIIQGARSRQTSSNLWNTFRTSQNYTGLPNGSESEIHHYVVEALAQVLFEADVSTCLSLRMELVVGGCKSDCWIIDSKVGFPVSAVEVKKPSDGIMKNENVNGQIYDYMREIQSFFGIQHVLGVVTTYSEWRVCWFPESNSFAGAKTQESAQATLLDVNRTGVQRKLCGTKIYRNDDDELLDVLASMFIKVKLSSQSRHSVKRFDANRHYMKVVENSYFWCNGLSKTIRDGENYDFININTEELFLLEPATLFPTAEGRGYIACDKKGSVCVVKFREKSSNAVFKDMEDKSRYSNNRSNLAKQELEIWKQVYVHIPVRLCTLNDRDALIMPYAEPISGEDLVSRYVEATMVLKQISEVYLTSAHVPYEKSSEVSAGFVEHADLKLSHFGLYGDELILFDFGIIEFHETQQSALDAMMTSLDRFISEFGQNTAS